METVLLVIHLLLAVALVITVLLQRSEGGALGMGGGGGGGMMTGRSAANILTRTTAVLAGCFMLTSILLTVIHRADTEPKSLIDSVEETEAEQSDAPSLPSVPFSNN